MAEVLKADRDIRLTQTMKKKKIDPELLHKIFFYGNILSWVLIVIGFVVFVWLLIRG